MNTGVIFLIMAIGGVVSAMIASSKHRSAAAWGLCGAMFPLISLIIILALERLPDPQDAASLNLYGGPR
jgi:hypothetical protein